MALVAVTVLVTLQLTSVRASHDTSVVGAPPPTSGTTSGPSPRASEPTAPAAAIEGPLFTTATTAVLLFDDGHDGAVAFDLETGTTRRVLLPGQRAGDQPFRLWQQGPMLTVGWGEVWRVSMAPKVEGRKLADATIFLPAANEDELWLVDWSSGRVGGGAATWTLLAAGRQPLVVGPPMTDGWSPVRGVPDGLALRGDDGALARYDIATGKIRPWLGGQVAAIADVTPDTVAWCPDDPCGELRFEGGPTGQVGALRDGATFRPEAVWLRQGGELLAADVSLTLDDGAVDRRLRVHDLTSGDIVAEVQLPLGTTHGAWDAAGEQFFLWVRFPYGGPRMLVRWQQGGGMELLDLPGVLDGAHGFVVLDRDAVGDPEAWTGGATAGDRG